jgi:DNA-binding HxlR family transcriptional regulator
MLGKTYDTQVCSIARSLELVGERWSLLIIRDALFARVTRFGDFQHNLGIATNVLTTRLDAFVGSGIMRREGSVDYVLTDKGRALATALIALTEWGDDWAAPGPPPILYRHTTCGQPVTTEVTCAQCGAIDPRETTVRIGPGMPAEYVAARRGGQRAP